MNNEESLQDYMYGTQGIACKKNQNNSVPTIFTENV